MNEYQEKMREFEQENPDFVVKKKGKKTTADEYDTISKVESMKKSVSMRCDQDNREVTGRPGDQVVMEGY